MRACPVFKRYAGFEQAVVATADDLAHARGIAAATNILQKQGMVEVSEFNIGEAKFASEAHAEQATAQRVAGHRALGEIQSEGQSGNDFSE
jgi:hypothetical protein